MSRCFPYPPPGYEKNGIRDEALIQSIKLQREGEKAKKERKKEKKREKKEKEKEKARENGELKSKKQSHKKRHRDERHQGNQKGAECQKSRANEAEHLEKSSLTEEHGYPVGSQNSSDSTLNSNKRQKQGLTTDDRHNSGSIIRIRLPLQRQKDPEMLPSKEHPCSALGRTDDASVERIHEPAPVLGREQGENLSSSSKSTGQKSTFRLSKEKLCTSSGISASRAKPEHRCSTSSSTGQELASRFSEEKPCTASKTSEISAYQAKSAVPLNLHCSCSPHLAQKFRDLVENWVPFQIGNESANADSQEWLCEGKQKQIQNCEAKRCDVGNCGSSTAWPRSCYLPEADIYALPFTIPF